MLKISPYPSNNYSEQEKHVIYHNISKTIHTHTEEMEDVVNEEGENEESSNKDEPKSSYIQEPFGVKASSANSGNLEKWVRVSDNLVKGLSEVASILGRER